MPFPVLLLFGPLLAGAILAATRRWSRATALAAAGATAVLWLLLAGGGGGLFTGEEWTLLGRAFVLTGALRQLFLLLLAGTGLLCLLAAALPQGSLFAPLSLLVLSPLSAALMIRPFSFGAVSLLIAAAVLAAAVQDDQSGSTAASIRFLALMSVASLLFLVADWMIAAQQLTFLGSINRLLLLGFVITLAGFPAYIWVPPLLAEGPALAPALALGLFQAAVLVFGDGLVAASEVMVQPAPFLAALRLSGAALLAAAGLLAWRARRPSRLLAYLLLIDAGALIVAVSGQTFDAPAGLALLGMRFLSLLAAGAGLSLLRPHLAAGRGLAHRAPGGVALFAYGSLSLLGLPLTLGFGGRWAALLAAGEGSPWLAALMLLATVGGAAGLFRLLAGWLAAGGEETAVPLESRWVRGAAVAALALGLLLALFPQTLLARLTVGG